jgi:hypothetical protein
MTTDMSQAEQMLLPLILSLARLAAQRDVRQSNRSSAVVAVDAAQGAESFQNSHIEALSC